MLRIIAGDEDIWRGRSLRTALCRQSCRRRHRRDRGCRRSGQPSPLPWRWCRWRYPCPARLQCRRPPACPRRGRRPGCHRLCRPSACRCPRPPFSISSPPPPVRGVVAAHSAQFVGNVTPGQGVAAAAADDVGETVVAISPVASPPLTLMTSATVAGVTRYVKQCGIGRVQGYRGRSRPG